MSLFTEKLRVESERLTRINEKTNKREAVHPFAAEMFRVNKGEWRRME